LTEKLLVRLEPLSVINAVRAATLGDGSYTITTAIKSSNKCFEKKNYERRKRKIIKKKKKINVSVQRRRT
jgi:hypothetical protein